MNAKIQLSDHIKVNPEFRKEFNDWLFDRFGSKVESDRKEKESSDLINDWREGGNEPIWNMDDLTREANSALDALSTHEDNRREKKRKDTDDNIFLLSKKNWADLRLFGPYIPSDNVAASIDGIQKGMPLPAYAFIGISREKKKKKKEEPDYSFIECRKMVRIPDPYICEKDTVAVYEIGLINKYDTCGLLGVRRFFSINENGKLRWLRRFSKPSISIIPRKKRKGEDRDRNIHIINNQKVLAEDKLTLSEKEWDGLNLASLAIGFFQHLESNWYLRVSDERGVVNFSITPGEAKILFKDRITEMARDGKRKRIVHWVRSHKRIDGSSVRTHIRGNRFFKWNGLDIAIYMPGKHAPIFSEMNIEIDEEWKEIPKLIRLTGQTRRWIEKQKKDYLNRHKNKETTVVNPFTGERFPINPL